MAEDSSFNAEDIVCRYYMRASCYLGSNCPISHVRTNNSVPDDICRYFLRGKCPFDKECTLRHIKLPVYFKYIKLKNRELLQDQATCFGPCNINPIKNKIIEPKSKINVPVIKNDKSSSKALDPNWVNAVEFVPREKKSYAVTLKGDETDEEYLELVSREICYFLYAYCPYQDKCPYIHGDMCDICNCVCLHPFDMRQRKAHKEKCEKELEEDMILSFAVQRSMDKSCGICMDVIMDKDRITERRFGILENCNHVFCLSCIRKWRSAKKYESRTHQDGVLDPFVTRACPECRRPSDFVTPIPYWFEDEEHKKKLIEEYKVNLSKKHCKYFKHGEGVCHFGSNCFYLHALPDGTVITLPPPVRRRRRNHHLRTEEISDDTLWEFFREREENILMHLDLDEFLYNMTQSDDEQGSEVSDEVQIIMD